LATAERLTISKRARVWVTADLKEAFARVPVPRLLDVVRKYLRSDELVKFIGTVLGQATVPGLRQGGPLSPLLLNLYLHHFLDRPWHKLRPDVPLIRYADDILLICRNSREAKSAYDELASLLSPSRMILRDRRDDAIRCLSPERPALWLGFRIERGAKGLDFMLTEESWFSLAEQIGLAHEQPNSPIRAFQTIWGWVFQQGPCYSTVDNCVYERIANIAGKCRFDEIPGQHELMDLWRRAYHVWRKIRKEASDEGPSPARR
jgi:hypothetical protein